MTSCLHARAIRDWVAVLKNAIALSLLLAGCMTQRPSHVIQLPASEDWPEEWRQFAVLLGKSFESPVVQEFVNRHELRRYWKFDSGGFDNKMSPFHLLYDNDHIKAVVVYIAWPAQLDCQHAVYKGELPHHLNRRDLPEDVVRKLGSPQHQPERDYLSYSERGLTITFDRLQHIINEIDLATPR